MHLKGADQFGPVLSLKRCQSSREDEEQRCIHCTTKEHGNRRLS